VQVVNLPGAGGGRAFVRLATNRRSDPTVFAAASPATTLNLAQGLFGSLGVEDVRWVAALAAEPGVLAVRADAPWTSLPDLLEEWRRSPGSIISAGGSAVASQDHVKVLLVAEAGGVDPLQVRYVPFDGPLDSLPTTFQAGLEVEWPTWRGFYLPGQVSDSVYHAWVERFSALAASREWESVRRTYRWEPFVLTGPEFETFVRGQVETFQGLARRMGLIR
jgi:putative tricarboxylic transport membrane protein